VFSFQARRRAELGTRIAMIHATRKLITLGEGHDVGIIDTIYDLETDPAEQQNLVDDPPAWYRALDARLRPLARALLVPIYSAETHLLTPEQQADLRALGYADF
jgi:hypothetical protein